MSVLMERAERLMTLHHYFQSLSHILNRRSPDVV